jgi:chromosome segregation ATPase
MKRKIFSKLLMGAFFIASVSAFVSCKDYDDDINANKADIKAVQEQLATLTSNLNSVQSQLQSQKTELEKELATAKSQLETQIANAKAELNAAIEKKADQSTVDALALRVSTLETNLAALKAAYEAKIATIESALASLQALIDKKADITYVDNAIAILNSAIEGKVAKDDFAAFKNEVAKLQNDLNNLATLANSKADQKDIDHAVENINAKLAALEEAMKTVVPQSEISSLKETITALQNSVNSLTQAVSAKAEQSAVDQLNLFYKELKEQVNALVTPAQLESAIATLKAEVEAKGAEESARLEEAINKVQEAVDANKTAAADDLKAAVETINTALGSKADVTELDKAVKDLNKAKEDIIDILKKYAAVTGDIDGINKTITNIQTALASKAAASDVEKLGGDFAAFKGVVDGKFAAEGVAIEALKNQTAAINAFLGELQEGATLAKTLDALKEAMSADAAAKVKAEEDARKAAIVGVQKDITALEKQLYGDAETGAVGDIDMLKSEFSKIDETIQTAIDANLANLMVFVQHMLTSVTLIPQLYLNGIEAIQFVSVEYTPQVKDYTKVPDKYDDATKYSGYWITNGSDPAWLALGDHQLVNKAGAQPVRVDNGETEAYYRLSPAVVKEDEIDTEKIKFVCTTAETATRGATLNDNNPVKPTFSKLDKGVLTVKLNKTVTGSLRYNGEDNGKNDVIASLMVPRKENKDKQIEYQEIYSEFNLIDEITISPRIAALNKVEYNKKYVFNGSTAATKHDPKIAMQYHFIDSAKIWRSQVDKNVWVKEEIQFDEEFDLMQLVTGCYDNGGHKEITKDELAKYGLEFRFYKPTKAYGDPMLVNYNFTDQQVFAKIEGSKISATLPSGASALGNRAVIGKEPIVRVELIDVNHNNNLVDMAYFKIKFVDNTPKKDPIKVTKETTQALECDGNDMVIRWAEFIEDVYAQMEGTYGTGLSWQEFRSVYPAADVERDGIKFSVSYGGNGSVTNISSNGDKTAPTATAQKRDQDRLGDVVIYWLSGNDNTESPAADANELWWTVDANDVWKILPARQKTITTKVIFVSNRPTDYGNIELTLKLNVKLPDTPELMYYENYWYDKYNAHYVLPVQYNTKAYYDQLIGATANNFQYNPGNIRPANAYTDEEGNAGAYCVYNNNLFNAFTFNQDVNTKYWDAYSPENKWTIANKYYNTPIPTITNYNCADWDFQFRLVQNVSGVNARPQYWTPTATEPLLGTGVAGTYTLANQYKTTGGTTNQDGAAFGAYNLETERANNYRDAIWMNWYNDDKATTGAEPGTVISGDGSWAWNVNDGASRPYLFADHFNYRAQMLINAIESNGIGKAPTFSDKKKVTMGMFLAWNAWNIECIKSYNICLVAPLDINAALDGFFEEGLVSGSFVNCAGAFTMVDFRGYEVKDQAPRATVFVNGQRETEYEFTKYRQKLYNYYECQEPVFDLTKIKYGMKYENGNVVVDNTVTIKNVSSKGLTSAQIEQYTNGNVVLSVEQFNPDGVADTQWLRFKNNGGSNVEDEVNVFIPATMRYGFGTVTKYVQLKLYPRGGVPGSVRNR